MIVFLRVDHRLLHGQVAFSWTQYVGRRLYFNCQRQRT
ncbi:PTS permease [Salmonella enterica subsp. enterica]|uniref:PTS permease n=1 Tax=Salmonella enterica I TaxID=59201 RepID=A0A379X223_SALET|nr:PTS permease [Salmonella enterica subsp. enterica]